MYNQAVGFSPKSSLLSGLKGKRDTAAGQMAYGQAMAGAADLNLARQNQNAEFGMKQLEAEQGLRQAANRTNAQKASSELSRKASQENMSGRNEAFQKGLKFSYDQMRKGQRMNLRQALLNQAARSFS